MRKRVRTFHNLFSNHIYRCEGCRGAKLTRNLSIWEGLYGNLLLCFRCRNFAYRSSDWHEMTMLEIADDEGWEVL